MADNNTYIATWSDDITIINNNGATYSRSNIGHGTINQGLVECVVAVWMTNTSSNTYLANAFVTGVGYIGQQVILPPYSTVVFKDGSEKLTNNSTINFSLTFPVGTLPPAPAAGEIVANVTIEFSDQQGN